MSIPFKILVNPVLLFPYIAAYSNSDFDAYHDSPKGEVNRNVFVNLTDVSDIINDKEDSSCLKSLGSPDFVSFCVF